MSYNILAINFNHDGAAAIIADGKIAAYVNTERFSKLKKHPGVRAIDIKHLLKQANLTMGEIGMVILCNLNNMDSYDIPNLHGSDLKETWPQFWINQTMTLVKIDNVELPCMVNPPHHQLHNALAFYMSPFEEAIIFSWDPIGYDVHIGRKNKLQRVDYSLRFNSCVLYSFASERIFGTGLIGAGKTMGLAPFGKPANERKLEITTFEDLLASTNDTNARYIDSNEKPLNATLAHNVQQTMENQLKEIMRDLYRIAEQHGIQPNICLGGGGALNSVANQVAFETSGFENIFIHPASGDDGTAIGAGLWYWYDQLANPRKQYTNSEIMYSSTFYEDTIESILTNDNFSKTVDVEHTGQYLKKAASLLADGKIVAWFQNGSEIGPRALGNRSLLADPRRAEMKDFLNLKVKFREPFRPFAPSVLNEFADEWFGLSDTPFMLRVCRVLKDNIPAICHIDNTARIQTVAQPDNPCYFQLIKEFHNLTGVPLLLNTSFNIQGQPIVESAEDALNAFLKMDIDALIFHERIVTKKIKIT